MGLVAQTGVARFKKQITKQFVGLIVTVIVLLGVGIWSFQTFGTPAGAAPGDDFVTTWQTDIDGTGTTTVIIPTNPDFTYNYNVDWDNDGIFEETGVTGNATHDFIQDGTYTIRISGTFPAFFTNFTDNAAKLTQVNQWGTGEWSSMAYAFAGAYNLTSIPTSSPNFGSIPDVSATHAFDSVANLEDDVSGWDTTNITDMSYMFFNAYFFNGSLSNWNTSNVTDMSNMFNANYVFNGDISNWDTGNVTTMTHMFDGASLFNQDLSGWDTAKVEDFNSMFIYAYVFESDLAGWNTESALTMANMFNYANTFNSNLSNWDTHSVVDFSNMFNGAISFNGDVSTWDTGSATNLSGMFRSATNFDGDISGWNVSNVQDVSQMVQSSNFSTGSYDKLLTGWSTQELQPNVTFDADGLVYCFASANRQSIIDQGWTINGDSTSCGIRFDEYQAGSGRSFAPGPIGTKLVDLSVENGAPRQNNPFELSCAVPGSDDAAFKIGGVNGTELQIGADIDPYAKQDAGLDEALTVCIRAIADNGASIEQELRVFIYKPNQELQAVSFIKENGNKYLVIDGISLVYSNVWLTNDPFFNKFVSLNGEALPFCTQGTGKNTEEWIAYADQEFGGYDATGMMSDSPLCYMAYSADSNKGLLMHSQARVLLPADYDTTVDGFVSVNNSDAFAFEGAAIVEDDNNDNAEVGAGTGDGFVPGAPNTGVQMLQAQSAWVLIVAGALVGLIAGATTLLVRRRFTSEIR